MDAETSSTLKETKQKLHSLILSALDDEYSTQNESKFETWSKREEDRITNLTKDLEKIRMVPHVTKSFGGEQHGDDGLSFPPPKRA